MLMPHSNHIIGLIASAKLKADNLAKTMNHNGLAGQIREIAVKDCIEPFLTQSYKCGTGKIIDSLGGISSQIDIVVYHRKVVPPVLVNQELGMFPVECVRYAIEVKTRITAEEIRDANYKAWTVSCLVPFPRESENGETVGSHRPVTTIFAFDSDLSGSEIDRYIKHTGVDHQYCVVLCVLGKGYWFYNNANRTWYGADTSSNPVKYTEFCMFMSGFMNTLASEETSLRPFRPGAYINIGPDIFNFTLTPLAPLNSPEKSD